MKHHKIGETKYLILDGTRVHSRYKTLKDARKEAKRIKKSWFIQELQITKSKRLALK